MKRLLQILKVTIVGGVLFLVPFVLLYIVIVKAVEILRIVVRPIADKLPVESLLGFDAPNLIAIILLVVLCFIAGLFAKSTIAKDMVNWLETSLLSNLPGYSFMKNMGEEAAGTGPTQQFQSVLVRFDDASQIGFIVERLDSGRVVIYIPDSPNPWTGSVFIFDEDRITLIDKATNTSIKVLQKQGLGMDSLVNGKI